MPRNRLSAFQASSSKALVFDDIYLDNIFSGDIITGDFTGDNVCSDNVCSDNVCSDNVCNEDVRAGTVSGDSIRLHFQSPRQLRSTFPADRKRTGAKPLIAPPS